MKVTSVKLPSEEEIIDVAAIAKTSYHEESYEYWKKELDYTAAKNFITKLITGDRPSTRHESVIEPLVFIFNITGVTRRLTAQLRTYRMASFLEKSFRKTRKITADSFLVPDSEFADNYKKAYKAMANLYEFLLSNGESPDDARLILGLGVFTEISMSINARSLRNFLTQRLAQSAGSEIKKLAKLIIFELIENELGYLIEDILKDYNEGNL